MPNTVDEQRGAAVGNDTTDRDRWTFNRTDALDIVTVLHYTGQPRNSKEDWRRRSLSSYRTFASVQPLSYTPKFALAEFSFLGILWQIHSCSLMKIALDLVFFFDTFCKNKVHLTLKLGSGSLSWQYQVGALLVLCWWYVSLLLLLRNKCGMSCQVGIMNQEVNAIEDKKRKKRRKVWQQMFLIS